MKGFPAKHTRLEISHRLLIHHSSCDILPPFPCHVPMTEVVHCHIDGTLSITNNKYSNKHQLHFAKSKNAFHLCYIFFSFITLVLFFFFTPLNIKHFP